MNSIIRLFKAVPVTKKSKAVASTELLKATVANGFVFSPDVIGNYSEKELLRLVGVVSEEVGLSGAKMNSAFHKSWNKIKTADIEQLVLEQIVHYFTTYGFESMGIYSSDTVYIPEEKLTIPKIKLDKISLIVIKGYTKAELKEKLVYLLGTGIALKEDTKKDVLDVVTFVGFNETEVYAIKNKEVRVALYDYLDICPKEPVEFLRYLIYKSTNTTLLIKDRQTITEIKTKDNLSALGLLEKYQKTEGLERLSSIFYRFKPLFLAFRTNKKLKSIINKIRKLAVKHHKPMPEDFLNSVTAYVKAGKMIGDSKLDAELAKVNIFRKIRLAYALKYRTTDTDSILYRIRNGKSFATTFDFTKKKVASKVLGDVLDSIVEDIKPQVDGKKIYIPKNIQYALPTTEKQFTGDMPSGSYVVIPKDVVVGVHWNNVGKDRVDLDLSMIRCDGGKIGWDASYRWGEEGGDVLFSGDMTDAPMPNGASELFYIKKQENASFILMLNNFNCGGGWDCDALSGLEVPFDIIVASEEAKHMKQHRMVDPNNIICTAKSKISGNQKMLGLLVTTPTENRFYFAESNIGNSITSYGGAEYIQQSRKYMLNFYTNTISLTDLLKRAGAVIVSEPSVKMVGDKQVKNGDCDIDLSYETIEKDSIIRLLTKC